MAGAIVERSVDVHTRAQVHGQISRQLPIILREEAVNVCVVIVVVDPTAAKTERCDSLQEVLPVREATTVVEEDLAVERLRELFCRDLLECIQRQTGGHADP